MTATPDRASRLADHSADRRMLLLAALALIVGAGGAVGAWLLLALIAIATNLFWFGRLSTAHVAITEASVGLAVIVIPVIGSLIVGVMARFGSDKIRGHGIPEAIEAILYNQSRLSPKVAILKPISAAISIGSGGPFGAEGPIIMTGGAIGSLFAQRFHLSSAERKTLLVAGAAAGMTAIFGTPLAAILLALEILLFEWKPRSFVPVAVAVLTATACRPSLVGTGPMFPVAISLPATGPAILSAAALGVAVGLFASLLSVLLYRIEDFFHRLPVHWMWWPALGAIVVGAGGLIDAHVLGAGYASIRALLDGALALRVVLALIVVKAVVWLVALGSGTSGGILAPLLILGGAAGALAGRLWLGTPGLWALVGMAGILSGAMRAPLTGALFAAEVTGVFDALPLTVASAGAAYAVSVLVIRRSILTEKIARRGRHIRQEYIVDPMELLQARDLMTSDPATLPGSMTVREALDYFAGDAAHRSYPVVDERQRLIGLVSRADVLGWRVADMPGDCRLSDRISDVGQPVAPPDAPAGDVADMMVESGVGRIPVVDPATRRVVGMLTRHDLLKMRDHRRRAEIDRTRLGDDEPSFP